MDELHETADAYYATASESIKQDAQEFFNAMDKDGDGKVSLHEYLAYMKMEGYPQMANPSFFRSINRDGSGQLTLKDVTTLYYIVKSGRQFCDGCGEFMKGLFFTCCKCFDDFGNTFNVCPSCFRNELYVHSHKNFLDNYVLLSTKRWAALKEKEEAAVAAEKIKSMTMTTNSFEFTAPANISTRHQTAQASSSNTCSQIVVYYGEKKKRSWMGTLKTLAVAAAAGSNCSIM